MKIANHTHYCKQQAHELIDRVNSLAALGSFVLHIHDGEIELCTVIDGQKTCFTHNLTDPQLIRRAQQKTRALLRACNNRKKQVTHVVDLTAGWAKDALVLAMHGQRVTMIEHNPWIHACMQYLLETAKVLSDNEVYQRLTLVHQHSLNTLREIDGSQFQCLYLDPMFPAHKSTARPGKELQLLQRLTANDSIEQVFALALKQVGQRVVVKRPLHAPTIDGVKPDIVYREKTVRFDVYLT